MRSFLQNDNMEMHSTHNEEKSIAAKKCIRVFKNRIYKQINIIKIVYIDKLDNIVNKYIHIIKQLKLNLLI